MANTVIPRFQVKIAEKYRIISSLNFRSLINAIYPLNVAIKWYKLPFYNTSSQTITFYTFTAVVNKTFILFGDPTNSDLIVANIKIIDPDKMNYIYLHYHNTEDPGTQQQAEIVVDTQTYSGDDYLLLGFVQNNILHVTNTLKLWNSINDGSGSGLDSDLLDGHDSSYFASKDLSNISPLSLLKKIETVDGSGSGLDSDLLDGHDTSVTPKPNAIPVSDSTGKLNLKWLDLPEQGLIYTSSLDITAAAVGAPVKYSFDFSNWYNDYKNNVDPNFASNKFLVIPIVTFSIFRVGNPHPNIDTGTPSMGDYCWVDYNASAPTYLNNTKYQFTLNLGATGTASDGTIHSYSTKGYCGFRIYFLGGPEGVLFKMGVPYTHS